MKPIHLVCSVHKAEFLNMIYAPYFVKTMVQVRQFYVCKHGFASDFFAFIISFDYY